MFRTKMLLASLGLCLAGSVGLHADEPTVNKIKMSQPGLLDLPASSAVPASPTVDNHQLANGIAARLKEGGTLKNYQIDIWVKDGVVELEGRVASSEQQAEVNRLVSSVPGVVNVIDRLLIYVPGSVTPAQHTLQPDFLGGNQPPLIGPPPKKEEGVGPQPPEPTPIFQAVPPGGNPQAYYPPKMPPYSWPTYAPYNNYSRVAYPTTYPYNSWPFIGPMYPFPKIPPGWRSITLTWQDGFWWYGRNSTGHDWWSVRYW